LNFTSLAQHAAKAIKNFVGVIVDGVAEYAGLKVHLPLGKNDFL